MTIFYLFLSLIFIIKSITFLLVKFQEKVIFVSKKKPKDEPFQINFPFTEIDLQINDLVSINSLYYMPEGTPKGYIFYLHGTLKNNEFQSRYASFFTTRGYAVWMMDYRGYGKSTGEREEQAMLQDTEKVLQQCTQTWAINASDIIIVGRSLGTGFATYLASKIKVKTCLLISPYYATYDVPNYYFFWKNFKNLVHYKFESFKYIPDSKCEIYTFQATKDRIVPIQSSAKLFPLIKNTNIYIIQNANHMNIVDQPIFIEEFFKIINSYS